MKAVEWREDPQVDAWSPHQDCVLEAIAQFRVMRVPCLVPVLEIKNRVCLTFQQVFILSVDQYCLDPNPLHRKPDIVLIQTLSTEKPGIYI